MPMSGSSLRGAFGLMFIGAAISGCLSEADGVEIEDLGEVVQPLCSTTKPLTATDASSTPVNLHATSAIDGDAKTFWRSVANWQATLTADLGRFAVVSKVAVNWAPNCGADYDIRVSTDKKTWTTVASVRGNAGSGVREVSGFSQKARYVQMKGMKPCKTVDGQGNPIPAWYEVRELSVFGDVATNCLKADGAECTTVAECAAGRCGVWYNGDADADGYGVTASPKKYCGDTVVPPGFLSSKKDCCDTDASASPAQESFFATPNACGSFDYDCDTGLQREYLAVSTTCHHSDQTCSVDSKGFESPLPACGESGTLILSCLYHPSTDACSNVKRTRTQRCN